MVQSDCRFFNGYKPCGKSPVCDANCSSRNIPRTRLLIIHLGAMGAVVRSTALLAAIHRKFPAAHLTWVTQAPMHLLLMNHPLIDRVLTTSLEDQLALRALEFDAAFVVDKSLAASGLLRSTSADLVFGFVADARTGGIAPATAHAEELWRLGLDDHQKFFVNKKTENQLIHEALDLGPYLRDDYDLRLSREEEFEAQARHRLWSLRSDQPVIGFNTGCGPLMPAKKWTVDFHRQVIEKLLAQGHRNLVLLGGPEDRERNEAIGLGLPVIQSETSRGVRDGLQSLAACDLIVTGDSFGLHLGISMKKFMIAWFGPSCAHEIELYGRGVKLMTEASCSPCWKRHCAKDKMCYDQIQIRTIEEALAEGFNWWTAQVPASQPQTLDVNPI